MHKKLAGRGFVALSVNLDENGRDAKVQREVLQRLTARGAAFTNVILDEDSEWLKKKLRFDGLPCVYVFNRQGKWQQFTEFDDEGTTYKAIDRLVADWLKQK